MASQGKLQGQFNVPLVNTRPSTTLEISLIIATPLVNGKSPVQTLKNLELLDDDFVR